MVQDIPTAHQQNETHCMFFNHLFILFIYLFLNDAGKPGNALTLSIITAKQHKSKATYPRPWRARNPTGRKIRRCTQRR